MESMTQRLPVVRACNIRTEDADPPLPVNLGMRTICLLSVGTWLTYFHSWRLLKRNKCPTCGQGVLLKPSQLGSSFDSCLVAADGGHLSASEADPQVCRFRYLNYPSPMSFTGFTHLSRVSRPWNLESQTPAHAQL